MGLIQMETAEKNQKGKVTTFQVGVALLSIGIMLGVLKAFKFPADYFTICLGIFGGLFFIAKSKGWNKRPPK